MEDKIKKRRGRKGEVKFDPPAPELIPTLEEFVNQKIYNPYKEHIDVIEEDELIILSVPGKWKIIINSPEGTIIIDALHIERYYDWDTITDIRWRYGEICSIRNIQCYREHKPTYRIKKTNNKEFAI